MATATLHELNHPHHLFHTKIDGSLVQRDQPLQRRVSDRVTGSPHYDLFRLVETWHNYHMTQWMFECLNALVKK